MIPATKAGAAKAKCVPRTRGDDPNAYAQAQVGTQCSPHTRG